MATNNDRDDLEEELEEEELEEEEVEEEEEEELDAKSLKEQLEKMQLALSKANKEAKDKRLQLKKLKENGLDVDDAINLHKKLKDEERKRAIKSGDVEKIKKQLEEHYTSEVTSLKGDNERLKKALYDTMVNEKVNQSLVDLGAAKGASKVIAPFVSKMIQMVEEDGRFSARVLDEDGDPRFNKSGDFMTVPELMAELREDEVFGRFFVQTEKSGGGSNPAGGSRGKDAPKNLRRSKMNTQEKALYIKEHGAAKYHALPQ